MSDKVQIFTEETIREIHLAGCELEYVLCSDYEKLRKANEKFQKVNLEKARKIEDLKTELDKLRAKLDQQKNINRNLRDDLTLKNKMLKSLEGK